MPAKRSRRRMHMRRTIGVSLAFLVIATTAMAKTPQKSASHDPGQPHGAKPQKAALRGSNPQTVSSKGTRSRSPVRYASYHAASSRYRHAASLPVDNGGDGGGSDPYL